MGQHDSNGKNGSHGVHGGAHTGDHGAGHQSVGHHSAGQHGDSGHGGHGPNLTPLGIVDVVLAGVVFYLLSLGVYWFIGSFVKTVPMDESALLQIQLSGGLFLLTWLALGSTVFKPFFDRAEEREARTAGDETQAQANQRKKRELDEKAEAAIRQARLQGLEQRDRKIAQAKKAAQSVLEEAQAHAAAEVQAARDQIAKLHEHAAGEVAAEGQKLASVVVERAMRATGSPTIH